MCTLQFVIQSLKHSLVIICECRDYRSGRAALFDGIEEGGIRVSSSYSSHEIDEQENDRAMDGLQDRVNMLKRVSIIVGRNLDGLANCEFF